MCRAYLYKLFRSPLSYFAVLGVAAVCATNFFNGWIGAGDVVNHMEVFLGLDAYRKIIAVLGALPFTANFAEEWNEAVTLHCVARRGIKKYSFSNVLFCWITSLLAVFLGMMLFTAVYSFFIPIYTPNPNPKPTPYGVFLDTGYPMLYLTARISIFSASCAMWSVMGLLLSAFFPNKYIAICSPFVASYVIERITIQFPDLLNLHALSLSYMDERIAPMPAFLYSLGVFAVISLICGSAFYLLVRKRVQCEFA